MRKIVVALLVLSASFVLASEQEFYTQLQISWTPPTERVDGTPLDPATEISKYDFQCALEGSEDGYTIQIDIPGQTDDGAWEAQLSDIFPQYGSYDCRMAAVDMDGLYSDFVYVENGPVVYEPVKPKAPTSLMILFG